MTMMTMMTKLKSIDFKGFQT